MKLSPISVVIFLAALGKSYVLPRAYDSGITSSHPSSASSQHYNASKPRSLTGSNAEVAPTQYHATCRNDVPALEAVIKSGGLTILPLRIWSDEFSWSGGYYLTPDLASAQYYAAVFLNHRCKTKGGGVVLELKLDSTDLRIRDGGQGKQGIVYRSLLSRFGQALKRELRLLGLMPPAPPHDPEDGPPREPLPPQADITQVRNSGKQIATKRSDEVLFWNAYDDLQTVDIVAGSASLGPSQSAVQSLAKENGLGELPAPFNQVVLISNTATSKVSWVGQTDIPPALAAKLPALTAAQEKLAAETKAEADKAAKAKASQANAPDSGSEPQSA
ncbi:hypothetical protein DFH06DRAFT_1336476 [Mycena polygramma]|nr:hypothetical protein DFH06DRAFT_1336476 [Mycena polygramma]